MGEQGEFSGPDYSGGHKIYSADESETSVPKEGSKWRHHSGRIYTVLFLTNFEGADGADEARRSAYPPTVIYQGENGLRWSGPLNDWYRRMTEIETRIPEADSVLEDRMETARSRTINAAEMALREENMQLKLQLKEQGSEFAAELNNLDGWKARCGELQREVSFLRELALNQSRK